MVDKDMRQKYIKSKEDYENMISNLDELQKDKDQMLEESFQHVVRLEQIALNADSLSTLVHLDFLIEKMKEKKGDTEKVQKLEEMKRQVHTGTRANYQLTAAGSQMKCYQLPTKKENIVSTVRRTTLGERNVNKKNKTILLVGETEEGKSTLINALVNYTMGVDWKDDVWFEIVEDEQGGQESDVIVYHIFGFEDKTLPYSLTVIDTPGYWRTTGTERDDIVRQRLFDLFRSEDGVHEINAVGLVLKATENRLSDRLRYIFDSVMSLFGKDMEKNIVALITHSNGLPPENVLQALEDANIKYAKDEDNEPVYFMFDNSQSTQRKKKTEFALKNSWGLTADQICQFTDFLKETIRELHEDNHSSESHILGETGNRLSCSKAEKCINVDFGYKRTNKYQEKTFSIIISAEFPKRCIPGERD
ncbi:uncharacterized protein LOC118332932 [Morone saxatilis]|uniref:uncharacterized protein LOC118332932 n=1 Tax=Morone saxatilis TaxID=34816 RepID=UPI0015E221E4|nr:uncharacterized protein LOC118332932 [Morone saxatilis]